MSSKLDATSVLITLVPPSPSGLSTLAGWLLQGVSWHRTLARSGGALVALALWSSGPALAQTAACQAITPQQQQRFDALLSNPDEQESMAANCARRQVRDRINGDPPGTSIHSDTYRRWVLDRLAVTSNGTLCDADMNRLVDAYIQAVAASCR